MSNRQGSLPVMRCHPLTSRIADGICCWQMTGGAGFGVPGAAAGGPAALGGIQEMDEEDDDDDGALLILYDLQQPTPLLLLATPVTGFPDRVKTSNCTVACG